MERTSHAFKNLKPFQPLPVSELDSILQRLPETRIAVLGDYCLDIYWFVDEARSEKSLETGLMTRPVRTQRYSLGGAGNVVNNLIALGCGNVSSLGVVGDDPWGREMTRLLNELGVDTSDMLVQGDDWATLAYNKPHIDLEESNRFDFGNFNQLALETAALLLARLEVALQTVDVVIINQQVREGIHSTGFRHGLVGLMSRFPGQIFISDSRHFSKEYEGSYLKINDHEATLLCGKEYPPEELVSREDVLAAVHTLYGRFAQPVMVTRGARGVAVADAAGVHEIPGIQAIGEIDTVGAGDSALAGISLGLAAGCAPSVAAQLGNLAAAVTIHKLNQTGTASPQEVLDLIHEAAYVFHPELAENPHRATYLPDTEIEVIHTVAHDRHPTHAIFDHDGTICTLRQGWENIIEPMMIHAVLGPSHDSADDSFRRRVARRVHRYIDDTTGIQTLVQMQGLVEMVREFKCVPPDEILDEFGYKKIYNHALMQMVHGRLEKLARRELDVGDFMIKNARPFLERLHAAGVRLYLASGTDQEDVLTEAEVMGYAKLFDGGIYGSVGDVTRDAKKLVLDRILSEIGEAEAPNLITVGDGPVEIRETRKRGGMTVGVASDEVRRFGLNVAKRSRLIKAGADIIVPDFSQMDRLLQAVGLTPST